MGKKNRRSGNISSGSNTAYQQKIKRWSLVLLIAPAVIFIFYWFAGRPGGQEGRVEVPPPRNYHPAGAAVKIDRSICRVNAGGTPTVSRTLDFGVNTVLADAGQTFAVVSVQMPGGRIAAGDWRLIDGRGTVFRPLEVTGRNPLPTAPKNAAAGEKYLVFRINAKTAIFFIQYTGAGGPATWRIDPNGVPARNPA